MDQLYQTIAAALAKDPRIFAAYVIGSTARGETGAESDFDFRLLFHDYRDDVKDLRAFGAEILVFLDKHK